MKVTSPLLVGLGLLTSSTCQTSLEIDLEYATYRGHHNATTGLNTWKGIRYAAPPIGSLRWQLPQSPEPVSEIVEASEFGPTCPQAMPNLPGAAGALVLGDEDCLFLNVYAPARSESSEDYEEEEEDEEDEVEDKEDEEGKGLLPVYVYIHGGGYGLGDGRAEMTDFITTNGNSFVVVAIQYRLGAFGFLASQEVKEQGVLNAGLQDQRFALEWVQEHIHQFGGDAARVTISGLSAGGGSVLLHAVAEDGGLGNSLFRNIIAASPWVPTQPRYDDEGPTRYYKALVDDVGCTINESFDCLVKADSVQLQRAAHVVSSLVTFYGNWAFIPVADGEYVTGPPSVLLSQLKGKVNGENILIGNNANEGPGLTPPTIQTEEDLVQWLKGNFPNLSDRDILALLEAYAVTEEQADVNQPRYETSGVGPGTQVYISPVGAGNQQRAYNIYGEASVDCVGYALASAFTGHGKSAWYYQYSVPVAVHGADLSAYHGTPTENQGPDLVTAFMKIYGNFITKDNPSIPSEIAYGASLDSEEPHPASEWPHWDEDTHTMLNLNQTGGVAYETVTVNNQVVMQFRGPGLTNELSLVDAYTWEGGRGERCGLWKKIGPFVPQ